MNNPIINSNSPTNQPVVCLGMEVSLTIKVPKATDHDSDLAIKSFEYEDIQIVGYVSYISNQHKKLSITTVYGTMVAPFLSLKTGQLRPLSNQN